MTLFWGLDATVGFAQFNIVNKNNAQTKKYEQKIIVPQSSNFDVQTAALLKEQRRQRLHDRNYFETNTSIQFNQFAYMNWAGGGQNSFNGKLTSLNTHAYTAGNISVDSYLNLQLGYGANIDEVWKTEDKLELNSTFNYRLWGRWSYSLGVNFSTQFAPGYSSDDVLTSKFFSPATFKPYMGFSYKYSDNQIITLAPISGNVLFVTNDSLSQAGAFGITPGKTVKTTIGSYINIQWTQKIDKSGILSYKTNLQSFVDYKSAPTLSWENWLNLTVLKYLTVGFYLHVVYDKSVPLAEDANTHWQLKESLGVGVSYVFKNKDKKPTNELTKIKYLP